MFSCVPAHTGCPGYRIIKQAVVAATAVAEIQTWEYTGEC